MHFTRRATLIGLMSVLAFGFIPADMAGQPDPQMKAVLDQLAALGPKPIEKLTPQEARKRPTPADAVKALLKKQGKSTAPEAVGKVQNTTIPGPAVRFNAGVPRRVRDAELALRTD